MPSKPIPLHRLGKNGPNIPAIGFGLMNMSYQAYGESLAGDEEKFALLDRAFELGETFWDTSDLYGDNEETLGKWFARTGKRDQIFLASKFGFVKGSKTYEVDSSAEYCKKACAESLRLLGVDYIDLYYVHSVNSKTPIEETMRALAELKSEGKIKHIGLSAVSSNTLRRACKIAPVTAVQIEYSPFTRDIEGPVGTHLLATCRELGVAVVISSPLGRGLLTSTFSKGEALNDDTDRRPMMMPRFLETNRDQNVKAVSQFKEIADKKGCSVSQLAIAWLLKQGNDIFPIPGTKRVKYLEDNLGAVDVSLTDDEEKQIRAVTHSNELAGSAIPESFSDYIYVDTVEE